MLQKLPEMLIVISLACAIVGAISRRSAYSTVALRVEELLKQQFAIPSFNEKRSFLECMMDSAATNCFSKIGNKELIDQLNGVFSKRLKEIYSHKELLEQAELLQSSYQDNLNADTALVTRFSINIGVPVCAAPSADSIQRDLKKREYFGMAFGIMAAVAGCMAVAFLVPGIVLAIHFGKVAFGALAAGHGASHLISEFFWFSLGLSLSLDGAAFALSSATLGCVGCLNYCFERC
eukprot:NODE_257_length_12663_cov_0.723655.p5 type:complete len:235 gc:universal NODE_257_length_12663_cov_0.723655:5236-4532(-)